MFFCHSDLTCLFLYRHAPETIPSRQSYAIATKIMNDCQEQE
jgi:hypothetical protein